LRKLKVNMNWITRALRKQGLSLAERFRVANRAVTVFPDDAFLISYPKSGHTWLRFLVASLVSPAEAVTLVDMELRVPSVHGYSDVWLRKKPRPRILASHECYDPRFKKVVYLVRDPRDAVVSSYYHHLRRGEIGDTDSIDRYVPGWLAGSMWSSPPFGGWREHVLSWLATRGDDPGFLLLRYEDMKKDPQAELAKVSSHLGLAASPQALERAVELAGAERMRELEKEQHEAWGMTKGFRQDVPFIRKAAAGGWKSVLSESSLWEIESTCGPVMRSLGYQLSTEACSSSAGQLSFGTLA
jgi:hypothetical protein